MFNLWHDNVCWTRPYHIPNFVFHSLSSKRKKICPLSQCVQVNFTGMFLSSSRNSWNQCWANSTEQPIRFILYELRKNKFVHISHTFVVLYFRCAGMYTMDVIAKTAFGLKVDSQKDKNNQFVTMAKKLFEFGFFNPLIIIACKYYADKYKN